MQENAGNLGLRLDFFEMMYEKLEVNIVAFGYRGFSYSEGTPSEEGLKKDADAIVKYLKTEKSIDQNQLFIQGRSLGGAVTIHTAVKYPDVFKGVIVENTFTSMADMVDQVMFFARHIKGYILNNHWRSIDLIGKIETPILFITGKEDELVPFEMTLELHEKATSAKQKELYIVFPGTHNDTWFVEKKVYIDKLKRFLSDCMVIARDNEEYIEEKKAPKVKKVTKKKGVSNDEL